MLIEFIDRRGCIVSRLGWVGLPLQSQDNRYQCRNLFGQPEAITFSIDGVN